MELQCGLPWLTQTLMENQLNERGKHCFATMTSIDTGEFSNSLGCCVEFYEGDLVGNSVLPYCCY